MMNPGTCSFHPPSTFKTIRAGNWPAKAGQMLIIEREYGAGVMLDVVGPLLAGAPQAMFRQAVVRALRAGYRRVVVNLRDMPSIDAAGIGALAEAVTTAQPLGVILVFAALSPRVRQLVAVTGLLAVLNIAKTAVDAELAPS